MNLSVLRKGGKICYHIREERWMEVIITMLNLRDQITMTAGERMLHILKEKGISVRQFGFQNGITQGAMRSKLQLRKNGMQSEEWIRLARAVGYEVVMIPRSEIVGDEEPETEPAEIKK